MAWVVIVTFRFASPEDRDALVTRVGELAAHLREHAPDMLSFRIGTLDSDPNCVALIERFTTKEAWQDLLQGTMFKEFSAWFDASSIKAERAAHCYNETTHGFTRR